jgi:predicted DNA-binding protein (MmcQ/YjbR family)
MIRQRRPSAGQLTRPQVLQIRGSVNLKCDPDIAVELRARRAAVRPGYHHNKRHWNTVQWDGSIADDELREMIDHSYELVVGQLTRVQRTRLFGP